ncbi:GNAT family N-acetyltransferase [Vibrio sp. Of14-4]|uniref:GNAT family N-acetyltransferase n=1 Tax=Vibrio sp. Of14-4 TaxID=2724878 RepID=UPI001EF320FA|nr:GNAT family N-acetyltransferase [Vibrio sp. Of14-4]MCG7490555.1 GNAT family N-acetyltransferase [Vibrio sp. Of14-4]
MTQKIKFRNARREDVTILVAMLADDELGKKRENYAEPLPDSYYHAFDAIDRDQNNQLTVVEIDDVVVGMLQVTYIPYLTYQGRWRALIEGVRISHDYRGEGLGQKMFEWAIEQAKVKGCHLVQLTSDKQRPRAIEFYKQLGFVDSHEGMKHHL